MNVVLQSGHPKPAFQTEWSVSPRKADVFSMTGISRSP